MYLKVYPLRQDRVILNYTRIFVIFCPCLSPFLVIAFPVIPENATRSPRIKYRMSTVRVAVSMNTPLIMMRRTPNMICIMRVYPRERILISSPHKRRGIPPIPIMMYEIIFLISGSRTNQKILSSSARFCTRNAINPIASSKIHRTIFAVRICLSEGRFISNFKKFIIVINI